MKRPTRAPQTPGPVTTARWWSPARGLGAAGWLVALHGVSSFCFGMVLPYTSIFLARRDGIGTGGVAAFYTASGAAALAVAALLTVGLVRPPRVALGLTGNALSCVAYLLLPAVGTLPAVAVVGAAVGAGQGCLLAAIVPIVSSLVPESETRRIFALRYQVLNGTLALGALVAGAATSRLSSDVLPVLFVVNAVGYLPLAVGLLVTRDAGVAGQAARTAEAIDGGWEQAPLALGQLLRATLGLVLFELVIALFAYSQFETTAPLVAYKLMGTGLGVIPVMIAVNVVVVVALQQPVTTLLQRRDDVYGLRIAVGLWVAAYAIAGTCTLLPPTGQLVGLLAYAAVFGLGECAYSCSFYPWLISKVPNSELTRATALTNGMMGIGSLAGPAIGVGLVTTGNASLVWLFLAALCSSAVLATLRVKLGRGSVRALLPVA